MLTLTEILADFSAYADLPDSECVKIDAKSADGTTPLHWMAYLGDSAAIEILAGAGANLDAQDGKQNTPLHIAVANRQATAARVLLLAGATCEYQNELGLTPRDIAAQDNYEPTLVLLPRE